MNATTVSPEYTYDYVDQGPPPEAFVLDLGFVYTITSICVPFDVAGIVAVLLVLALSCVRHKAKFNLGPRIFTVNMMLFDAIHAITSFLFDLRTSSDSFSAALVRIGVSDFVTFETDTFRSLAMLVSNCSVVPMMVMSIVACFNVQRISDKEAAIRFTAVILLADLIPVIIQVISRITNSVNSWSTLLYTISTFVLYVVQLSISGVALVVLYLKSSKFTKASDKSNGGMNKNLRRMICFAVGTSTIQIPFAIFLVVCQIGTSGQPSPATLNFMIKMTYIVRLVFSVKPLVDALCTLLFLGEYRQYTINFWKLIRGKKDGATTTRVTEFQRKPAPTRSAMPSAATGHVTSLQNGIRSPGMPRSSSLPVTIKTISTS